VASLVPNDGMNQALALFDVILQKNPKHDIARMGKVVILLSQKKFKQAEPIIRELAHDDKLSADVWVALAAVDLEVNDRARSTADLQMAKKLEPELFQDIVIP